MAAGTAIHAVGSVVRPDDSAALPRSGVRLTRLREDDRTAIAAFVDQGLIQF